MDTPTSETNYLDKRNLKYYLIVAVLIVASFGVGFASGEGKIKVADGKLQITHGNAPSTSADYSLLWDALDAVNSKFVDRPLDQQKLLYGAVQGLVGATGDPYTTFFDPEEAKQFTEGLRGSFGGIGAQIGVKDGHLVIIAPLDDTPAKKAGLAAGDLILAIDDVSTEGMSADVAVTKIRGPSGTSVKLKILPKGTNTPKDLTITRAKIEIKSVKLETKEIGSPAASGGTSKKIAVIKLSEFGDDTKGLLDQAVGQIATGNYNAVILDLRNNPGGYLDTAVTTISNWIDEGQVALKEIGFDKKEKEYKTAGVARLKGLKTVILVNDGSASASEIVAGALQDYGVATLVGIKTFGKGSVQELQDLRDGTEIKITVAKWFTPKGRGIDKTGLEPDIKVELTADDVKNNKDPQMDKAMELLGK